MMLPLIDALFLIMLACALVVLVVRDYAKTSWPVRVAVLGIVYLALDLAFHRLAGLDSPRHMDIAYLRSCFDGLVATLAVMRAWYAHPVGTPITRRGNHHWLPYF